MNANVLDSPLELQKFLCSLHFPMSLRCCSGGGTETPWEKAPTRQPEGLFPGHYTSACHLCHSWNCCLLLIIRVHLWQLFPVLAAFPAARARARSHQGLLCWTPCYLCARHRKNQIQTLSTCPSHSLSRVQCFHSGSLVIFLFFCQEGRDAVAGISTCLGIQQRCVAAWRERRCLKSKEGHHLGDKCHFLTHSKSSGKLLFERFEGKLGQSRPIGSTFPCLVRIKRDDGLDSTEYLISVF